MAYLPSGPRCERERETDRLTEKHSRTKRNTAGQNTYKHTPGAVATFCTEPAKGEDREKERENETETE